MTSPEIVISAEAARFLRERGGELYVWGAPRGLGYAELKWSTSKPPDEAEFEMNRDCENGTDVHFDAGLNVGDWLDVRVQRFPGGRLVLDWRGSFAGFS